MWRMGSREVLKSVGGGLRAASFAAHVAAYERSPHRALIDADVRRWLDVAHLRMSERRGLVHLLARLPEFRTLFYFRLGGAAARALRPLGPGMPTLFMYTDRAKIGPGLFIQHGFATVIAAQEVGANCWVNQQVTIGYTDDDKCPTLEDHVTVGAGAIVLGDITLGRGTTVAAGAVVVKDTPPMSVVAGVPARVIKVRDSL